ncbi:MAG: hypothetical protein K0U59_09120, partial [Gammaproteobacteria bacterium]|nr:hypothetical protein [Gammaproteobacteria bacterium]
LEVDCKLLQSVHLGKVFTITPVWMGDNIVKLYIVARDGGELTIVEQTLPTVKELQLVEDQQKAQASEDNLPPKPPRGDSGSQH